MRSFHYSAGIMMNNKYLILAIIFIFVNGLWAQQQDSWITYNQEDGLAHHIVNCMIQDSEGTYWFGTSGGVSRYKDGTWHTFKEENSGLTHDEISAIFEDSQGTLWIGTSGGGICLLKNEIWNKFSFYDSIHDTEYYVTDIYEDNEGSIWICAIRGVIRYKNGRRDHFSSIFNSLSSYYPTSVIQDHEGSIWFGTFGGGIKKYKNGSWEEWHTSNSGLADNNVWALIEDNTGALWFGLNVGMCHFKNDTWTCFFLYNMDWVLRFFPYSKIIKGGYGSDQSMVQVS